MGDAIVEPERNHISFFCHKCIVEFDDDIQIDTCPYCETGFIEQIEINAEDRILRSFEESEYSDAAMSNLNDGGGASAEDSTEDDSGEDDTLEIEISNLNARARDPSPPMLHNLSLLVGRTPQARLVRPPRTEHLTEQLVWILGAGRGGGGEGLVTGGGNFMLFGAHGDYVLGGEGLDTVVTQLLGQIENTGPPPLPAEQISMIRSELVTAEQVAANLACSVCFDVYKLDESVSRLECHHIFHKPCINKWLRLHATCPICRHSLLPSATQDPAPQPPAPQGPAPRAPAPQPPAPQRPALQRPALQSPAPATAQTPSGSGTNTAIRTSTTRDPLNLLRERGRAGDSSSSNSGSGFSRLWAQVSAYISALTNVNSSASINSSDANHFIDFDFD